MSDTGARWTKKKKKDLYPLGWWLVFKPAKSMPRKCVDDAREKQVEKPQMVRTEPEIAVIEPNAVNDSPQEGYEKEPANVNKGNNTIDDAKKRADPQPPKATATPAGPSIPATNTPPDPKPKRLGAQSNTKAKRQQSKEDYYARTKAEAHSPQSSAPRTSSKRKKLAWAMDIENSRGTGIRKSDARIFVDEDTGFTAKFSDSDSDSDQSMIDPTPPVTMLSKRPLFLNNQSVQSFIAMSDFDDIGSVTSPTAASAIDVFVGPTQPSVYDGPSHYAYHEEAAITYGMPDTQKRRESADGKEVRQEQDTISSGIHGILKSPTRAQQPKFVQGSQRDDNAKGHNNRMQGGSTAEQPEMSFTFADLRRLKGSNYDPIFVQAVGRGDTGVPLLKRRQTSTDSSNDPLPERIDRNSRSGPGHTESQTEAQDSQVEHAIEDAMSNTERNRGMSPGGSSNLSAKGLRRSSLELARRNRANSSSSTPEGSRSRHSSDRQKPIFAFQPTTEKHDRDGRKPLVAVGTQRGLEEARTTYIRARKESHDSSSTPSPYADVQEIKIRKRNQGMKTSQSSYQHPYVSDENERSVFDDESYIHISEHILIFVFKCMRTFESTSYY